MEIPTSPKEIDPAFWNALFFADNIAVIGARKVPGTWGYDAMKAALESAAARPGCHAYPVNPNETEVLGLKSYTSILDIHGPVDLAIIVVPASVVPGVFRQCAEKRVKATVIITAGFAETDEEGARLQDELVETASRAGIHFVGPNCNGHGNMHNRVISLAFAHKIPAGSMALLSQSGTMGASIIQIAAGRGIGLSKVVSTGNEASVRLEDYLEYLAKDETTRVITAYIEGLREGRRFYNLAREITRHKPVVVVKSGTTGAAARAARSHTGALAGSDAIYSAAFKQAGVIRTEDEEELCDVVLALLNLPLPRGNRIAILTLGGGFGVVTAEDCEKEGLEIATLEPQTLRKMAAFLPSRWTPGNPVDLVGFRLTGGNSIDNACIQLLLEDNNVDSLISLMPPVVVPQDIIGEVTPERMKKLQQKLDRSQAELHDKLYKYKKPLVYIQRITIHLPSEPKEPIAPPKATIPRYTHPRRAARVLRYLTSYRRYLESL